eukprot:TRINITY_DN3697_c0_g1_i6.p2 TRINITY_DN3697_c0_g1~~TRINITY_DN3697_c0_g1_i6.p2  ORF type:complete len:108 (-),score=22.77 TRINITY_DN3697_c0_g1_i6:86-409(-)
MNQEFKTEYDTGDCNIDDDCDSYDDDIMNDEQHDVVNDTKFKLRDGYELYDEQHVIDNVFELIEYEHGIDNDELRDIDVNNGNEQENDGYGGCNLHDIDIDDGCERD